MKLRRLVPLALAAFAAWRLLPDETRPALVWGLELDETGEGTAVTVHRAFVRSRAKLDYTGVQRSLDGSTAEESLQLLREVGLLRQAREARRGGINLPLGERVVVRLELADVAKRQVRFVLAD